MTSLVNKPLFKTVSSHPFVQGVYMPHSLSWAGSAFSVEHVEPGNTAVSFSCLRFYEDDTQMKRNDNIEKPILFSSLGL